MDPSSEDWNLYILADIGDVIISGVDKKSLPHEKEVRLCNYMDVFKNERITADLPFMIATASPAEISKCTLQKHDVVITKDSETAIDIAQCAVVVEDLGNVLCGYHLAIIRADPQMAHGPFLRDLLHRNDIHNQFVTKANGVTRFGLPIAAISGIELELPSVVEQRRISQVLEKWAQAIDHTERLIEALKKRKKGLMQRLLTGDVRFPEFRGNEVPQYSMFELTNEMYGGGTPSTKNEEYWHGDIPWITGSAIDAAKVAKIEKHISEAAVTESSTRIVPRGSILLVTRTGVGKIAIAPCDIAISQDFTGVIADPSLITPEFLYYSLLGTIDQLQQLNQGTSINGVTREDLKKHRLMVPELNEQLKITEVLKACDLEIEFRLKLLEHLKIQKKGIMQRLLTGLVRVKVD